MQKNCALGNPESGDRLAPLHPDRAYPHIAGQCRIQDITSFLQPSGTRHLAMINLLRPRRWARPAREYQCLNYMSNIRIKVGIPTGVMVPLSFAYVLGLLKKQVQHTGLCLAFSVVGVVFLFGLLSLNQNSVTTPLNELICSHQRYLTNSS